MNSPFDLSGCVALVTGAASGIGQAIAATLGRQGAAVILADINEQGCCSTAEAIAKEGIAALPIAVDLAHRESVDALLANAIAWRGRVDILVCSAGVEGHVGTLLDVSNSQWNNVMTVNLQSALWLSSGAAPVMRAQGKGRIIFISSIAGLRGNKMIGLYGVAKAGLSQLARNLAVELGPDGITVNTVAPGLIETPLSKPLMGNGDFMSKRLSMTPLRRVGTVAEVSGVVSMLAAAAGGFITGQTIVVDGGTVISDGN